MPVSSSIAIEAVVDAIPEMGQIQDGSSEYQVFDMQGRLLGVVTKTAGVNLDEAIVAKFGKTGVYMVKNRGDVRTISVIR